MHTSTFVIPRYPKIALLFLLLVDRDCLGDGPSRIVTELVTLLVLCTSTSTSTSGVGSKFLGVGDPNVNAIQLRSLRFRLSTLMKSF